MFLQRLKVQLPVYFLLLLIVSLYLHGISKALLSISMIGLVISVFISYKPFIVLKSFLDNKAWLIFTAGFVVLLLSFPDSENVEYYFNRLQIKLPLLLLPLAFAGLTGMDKSKYKSVLAFYVIVTFIVACITFSNYLIHYSSINESYLKAKVMPTIINHVRFSIMIAIGCYLSYFLYKTGFVVRYTFEKWIYICISILLFIFLHIYSVRSGLLAIYGIIITELIIYTVKSRNYRKPILLAGSLGIILSLLVYFTPTLRNKWINTREDISIYLTGGYANYNSLTTRFISYEAAIAIFKRYPWMGCGLGDIKNETDDYFKTHHPEVDIPILPHNQFLFYLAATGITGLVLFISTFFFPLFYNKNYKNEVLLMQYVVLLLSFQTEPMLETQLGIACAIIFILLPLTQKSEGDLISA